MIVPRPQDVAGSGEAVFEFGPRTVLAADPAVAAVALLIRQELGAATGFALPEAAGPDCEGSVLRLGLDPALPAEGYRLRVERDEITVEGGDPAGVFYGYQSLRQLLPPEIYRAAPVRDGGWAAPAITIQDAPRFRWRGAMLDVVRHFLPKREVLRFIDLLAVHRMNVLHLHLTDDQGWRIEIDGLPRLTEVGSWRPSSQVGAGPEAGQDNRPHGGFYTRADLAEIVAYAARRHITVVPEVEVPGHVSALLAAYPELGVGGRTAEVWTHWGISTRLLNAEESTLAVVEKILDQVMDIFPSAVIGIGGDECPKDEWQADPRTQQLIAERGLAGEQALQAWFVARLSRRLAARGRRPFCWDEILEGDADPEVVVACWRGDRGVRIATGRGLDAVACPDDQVYLDYRQSDGSTEPIPVQFPLSLERVYDFDPVPADLPQAARQHVLGGQAGIWTEHMDSPRAIDYQVFPRLCAIAEALWSAPGVRDFTDFRRRLEVHYRRLDALGVEYRPPAGPHPWQTRPGIPGRPVDLADRQREVAEMVSAMRF